MDIAEVDSKNEIRGWRRTFSAFGNFNYRILWFSMFASFSAMQMQQIARGWLTAEITGNSAIALGVVALAWGIPQMLFGLVGGAVADRLEKRGIMITSQVIMGLLSLINAILVHAGVIEVWHLFALGLFQGAIFAFNMPARQALLAEILSEKDLMNGIALSNAAMNLTRIAAPSLAGILIALAFFGLTGVYYLIAVFYLIVVISLFKLPRGIVPLRANRAMLDEIGEGLNYIRASSVLTTLIGLAFIVTLLGMPYMTLLPLFARTVHQVGSEGLGMMSTVSGIGALVGSLVVSSLSDHPRKSQMQLMAGIGFGAFLFVFASAMSFQFALGGLMLMGFCGTIFMSINNTLVMMYADPEYHGRVMSVYMMTWSFMPIASLPMTIAAEEVGPQATLAAMGLVISVCVFAVALLNPKYRRLQTLPGTSYFAPHVPARAESASQER
jgi:MFS family permease